MHSFGMRGLAAAVLMVLVGCGAEEGSEVSSNDALTAAASELRPQWAKTIESSPGGGWEDFEQGLKAAYGEDGTWVAVFRYGGTTASIGGVALPPAEYWKPVTLVKFAPNGRVLWSKILPPAVELSALAVDKAGNLILAGSAWGTADLGGGPLYPEGAGGGYLAKLAGDGTHRWSRRTRPESGTSFGISGLAVNPSGGFVAVSNFYRYPYEPEPYYQGQLMVIRYREDGSPIWTRLFEQPQQGTNYFTGRRVAVDAHGQIYVTGSCGGRVALDALVVEGGPLGGAACVASFRSDGKGRFFKLLSPTNGSAGPVDTRDGHLLVGLFGQLETGKEGAYVVSMDLAGRQRWFRQLHTFSGDGYNEYRLRPYDLQLGPNKELVTASRLLGNTLGVEAPGGTYYDQGMLIAKFDRVTGALMQTRRLMGANLWFGPDSESEWNTGDLAIHPKTGEIAYVGTLWGDQNEDLGTDPPVKPMGPSDGFIVTMTP